MPRSGKRSWPGPRPRRPICQHWCRWRRFTYCLFLTAYLRPARPHCAQEGDNLAVFPFLRINPFPSGRAARTKISGAFRLPPICRITVSTTAATPWRARSVRLHTGTRPERRLHENGSHKPCIDSTPAFQIRREAEPPRRYRKSNFSTVCGQICLRSRAAANIPQRG